MTAREVMSQPAVTTGVTTSIEAVARLMCERGIGGVLITDAAGQAEGIITQSDLLHRVAHPHLPPHVEILGSIVYLTTPGHMDELMGKIAGVVASDAMHRELVTAAPDTPVADLADLMLEHKIGRIPIVEEGRPVGMVTRSDLIRRIVAGMAGK